MTTPGGAVFRTKKAADTDNPPLFPHLSGFLGIGLAAPFPELHVLHLLATVALERLADKGGSLFHLVRCTVFIRSQIVLRQMAFGQDLEVPAAYRFRGRVAMGGSPTAERHIPGRAVGHTSRERYRRIRHRR